MILLRVLFGVLLWSAAMSDEGYRKGLVSSDKIECSRAGRDILKKGGSAVDAAISTLLCLSVAIPESTGIGGGFIMTIYNRKLKRVEVLDARETAPAASNKTMYVGLGEDASIEGPLSIAVPGFINGIAEAHLKYGVLKWHQLFDAAINISKNGFVVEKYLEDSIADTQKSIEKFKTLRDLLQNKEKKRYYKAGDVMKNEKLSETLSEIAEKGPDVYIRGTLGKNLVRDIKKAGGIITEKDLENYSPRWLNPVVAPMPNSLTLCTCPLPGSGALLAFIMNIMKQYKYHKPLTSTKDKVLYYHRVLESFKFAYARRMGLEDSEEPFVKQLMSELTSETYAKTIRRKINDHQAFPNPKYYEYERIISDSNVKDHGTSHVSILAPNGDAVSVTSTINYLFGSLFVSPSTGIILNDEMDDFSSPNHTNIFNVPPTKSNNIYPGRRPLSSMIPSIFIDKTDTVRLVIGATGGTRIPTSVTLVTMANLWLNQTIDAAISGPRLHNQFAPITTEYEKDFPQNIIKGLEALGQRLSPSTSGINGVFAVVRDQNGLLSGAADLRKNRGVAGY